MKKLIAALAVLALNVSLAGARPLTLEQAFNDITNTVDKMKAPTVELSTPPYYYIDDAPDFNTTIQNVKSQIATGKVDTIMLAGIQANFNETPAFGEMIRLLQRRREFYDRLQTEPLKFGSGNIVSIQMLAEFYNQMHRLDPQGGDSTMVQYLQNYRTAFDAYNQLMRSVFLRVRVPLENAPVLNRGSAYFASLLNMSFQFGGPVHFYGLDAADDIKIHEQILVLDQIVFLHCLENFQIVLKNFKTYREILESLARAPSADPDWLQALNEVVKAQGAIETALKCLVEVTQTRIMEVAKMWPTSVLNEGAKIPTAQEYFEFLKRDLHAADMEPHMRHWVSNYQELMRRHDKSRVLIIVDAATAPQLIKAFEKECITIRPLLEKKI